MSIFSDQMMFHCPPMVENKWNSNIPLHEFAPNCPRCASSNTKFCYYNNYSLSQPRYFCKGCRRYWTKGGSLRNVPVGGGCRKNRRAKAARRTIDPTNFHSISSTFNGDRQSYEQFGSPNSDTSTTHSNGSEIDMALVFAKYLNQDSSSGEELRDEAIGTSGSSNSLNQDYNRPENHVAMECNQDYPAMDLIRGSNSIEQVMPHQEILAENEFGVLGVVEEVSQDALWCDDANTLPQLTWQSAVQLPEFDAFHDSDHDRCFRIPTNLISDGWSSFNLPMLDNQNAAVLNR